MDQIISVILESGKTALDMALYILLPIMVIMLAIMKLLDAKGVLAWISNLLAPVSRLFGIPGIGIFAMIKLLFVSFAGPMASMTLMDRSTISKRYIASTLAMVFCMSQANATFPLAAMGLDLVTAERVQSRRLALTALSQTMWHCKRTVLRLTARSRSIA